MTNPQLFVELKTYVEESLNKVHVAEDKLSLNNGTCYTASKVACKMLQKLGYDCQVQRVIALVGNEIGRKIFAEQEKTGNLDKEKIVKASGWTVGIGVGNDEDSFHYIIYFPKEEEIMDITFGQANRPEHNMKCEAYWEKFEDLPETIIKIQRVKNPDNLGFNPLINAPETKDYFKKVILEGVKLLERYKK